MTEKEYQRYWRRVKRYGFTEEEAYLCPPNTPLWMYRLEIEESLPFKSIVAREIKCGCSCSDIAASIGIKSATLYHWIRKLGLNKKVTSD